MGAMSDTFGCDFTNAEADRCLTVSGPSVLADIFGSFELFGGLVFFGFAVAVGTLTSRLKSESVSLNSSASYMYKDKQNRKLDATVTMVPSRRD